MCRHRSSQVWSAKSPTAWFQGPGKTRISYLSLFWSIQIQNGIHKLKESIKIGGGGGHMLGPHLDLPKTATADVHEIILTLIHLYLTDDLDLSQSELCTCRISLIITFYAMFCSLYFVDSMHMKNFSLVYFKQCLCFSVEQCKYQIL